MASVMPWVMLVVAWTLLGTLPALTRLTFAHGMGTLGVLELYVPVAWLWAALTPVVGWWDRVVRSRVASPVAQYAGHLPLLAVAAILHTAVRRELTVVVN